jgi:LacI family transcriptional regulator
MTRLERRRSGMRDVAERAGVAMSSVSRVLSDHPDVSPAMRERVLATVNELGYQPDLLAQSLRRNETRSIGFVGADISNPLLAHIVRGAETTLTEAGYSLLVTNSLNQPELDLRHVQLFEQRRTDGLILLPVRERNRPLIEELAQFEGPIVVIDRNIPASVNASRVLSDHRAGVQTAVEYLLDMGHRRIGLITGQRVRPSAERRAGLEDAFAARGLQKTYVVHPGAYTEEHGGEAMRQLLELDDPLTAVIAGSNQITIGALRVLHERGISIGPELSFISCDDVAATELHAPPIAVVIRDPTELGTQAARLLLKRLRDPDLPPEHVVLPTRFVPRASCVPPQAMGAGQPSAA